MNLLHVPPINPNRRYRPMEIKFNGWIVNSKNKPDYDYILKLINEGVLPAKNVAMPNTKLNYFMVLGKDVVEFRKKNYEIDTPITESDTEE